MLGKLSNLVTISSSDGFQIINILGFKIHYKNIVLLPTEQEFVIPEINKLLGYSIVPYNGVPCSSEISYSNIKAIKAKLNANTSGHDTLLVTFSR